MDYTVKEKTNNNFYYYDRCNMAISLVGYKYIYSIWSFVRVLFMFPIAASYALFKNA